MNRAPNYILAILLTSMFVAACGSSREITHDASDVLGQIQESYRATSDLAMKGTMKVSDVPATIWFETLVKGYDSLKMVMTGPFGINIGALSSTPKHFTFLELFQNNVAYEGTPNRETFTRSMQLGLGYREIVALMRCEVPHIPSATELRNGKTTVENAGDEIRYIVPQGAVTESFTVDPEKLVITRYELRRKVDGREITELEVTYDNFFLKVGKRVFPEKATAVLNDGQQTLRITLDKIKDEIENEQNLTLNIPAGMERKTL